MQPQRMLVVDKVNKQGRLLENLDFFRETSGRRKGKLTRPFPRGILGLVSLLAYKADLQDLGVQLHTEFTGKVYPECTMFCTTQHHIDHTQECRNKRGVK